MIVVILLICFVLMFASVATWHDFRHKMIHICWPVIWTNLFIIFLIWCIAGIYLRLTLEPKIIEHDVRYVNGVAVAVDQQNNAINLNKALNINFVEDRIIYEHHKEKGFILGIYWNGGSHFSLEEE